MALVFFDIDGTLLSGASGERRFAWHLARTGVLGCAQYRAYGGFLLRQARRYGGSTAKRNKAWLQGLSCATVAERAQGFVRRDLGQALYQPALARLRRHQAVGDRIVCLTGMPDFLAQPLARMLEVDQVIATQCAEEGGHFSAAVPRVHPLGIAKLALASAFCTASGTRVNESGAYADAWDDRFLLQAVATPVAVRPARRLRRLARASGWEILEGPGGI